MLLCLTLAVASILRCDGVDVNCCSSLTGYTPLIWAADRGHAEVTGIHLSSNILPSNKPSRNIYLIFHFLKVVEELLKHPKTDVNKPDKNGYSALIWAADLNQPDIVKILLKHPAIEVKCEM